MPYSIVKFPGGYKVQNTATGAYHSNKPIPLKRAESQMRLLRAIQFGFVPKK